MPADTSACAVLGRRVVCVLQSGIPRLVHWLLIGPKIRRYDRRYMQPLQRVIGGSEFASERRGIQDSAKDLIRKQVTVSSCRTLKPSLPGPKFASEPPGDRAGCWTPSSPLAGRDTEKHARPACSCDQCTLTGWSDGVAGQQAGACGEQHAAAGGSGLHGVIAARDRSAQ